MFFAGCLISRGSAGRPDWKPLFNAKNLDGWSAPRPELWIVENGMLIGRSPGIKENSFIYTGEKYADFDLRYDVRLVKDEGNSGMQIRSGRRDDGHARGYQVDIGKGYWASLYHEEGRGMLAPFKRAEGSKDDPIKLDQFNHFDVTARGHHLTVKVNGVITVDLEDEMGEETGFIAPQIHAGGPMEVQFKNIDIRVYEKGK
ncbi:DUF1080 domain-containing protein [Candidatus Sumerlaeota bacterium]|nr:DUF1080 domain-containing protein [Candidatus Sumerlaeota bacterium]